ncbi:MAG: sodium:calcium antiporter [Candidatus Diapherotrites archaeon]
MSFVLTLVFMVAALAVLVKASDSTVNSAVRIARILGVSELVIGLTIVAIGTSLPETVSAIFSALNGNGDLILGNITGSNISLLTLVLGVSLLMGQMTVSPRILKRDMAMMIFSMVLLVVVVTSSLFVSILEGIMLLFIFIAFIEFIFMGLQEHKKEFGFSEFFEYLVRARHLQSLAEKGAMLVSGKKKIFLFKKDLLKEGVLLALSIAFVVFSAEFLVKNAISLAEELGVSTTLIGFILALGTTLPELSVSISAVKVKKHNMLLGNIFGSCITNSLFVLGLAAIAREFFVSTIVLRNSSMALFLMTLISTLLLFKNTLSRKHGIMLLASYFLFLAIMVLM